MLPALQGTGPSTKPLIGDSSFDTYDARVVPLIDYAAIRGAREGASPVFVIPVGQA